MNCRGQHRICVSASIIYYYQCYWESHRSDGLARWQGWALRYGGSKSAPDSLWLGAPFDPVVRPPPVARFPSPMSQVLLSVSLLLFAVRAFVWNLIMHGNYGLCSLFGRTFWPVLAHGASLCMVRIVRPKGLAARVQW